MEDLHCSCRLPEVKGDKMAECDVVIISTVLTFPMRYLVPVKFPGRVQGVLNTSPGVIHLYPFVTKVVHM